MRLIPVLDLKGGIAVHAVRGERDRYAPVRSVLAASADPVVLARAFTTKLGCRDCYVADLDAIQGHGDHGSVIRGIADLGIAVWLDAGIASPADAARALASGAARVIIGTETLGSPDALHPIVSAVAHGPSTRPAACVLSLDLRDGRLLGGSSAVERFDPIDLATLGWAAGITSFIVLDLARVGSGSGVQTGTAMKLRAALPRAEIIAGGGVRDATDVRELARLGLDGVLAATALHTGAITRTAVSEE
jgi:HisA/HisF family protein